jgi:hypothetical protein
MGYYLTRNKKARRFRVCPRGISPKPIKITELHTVMDSASWKNKRCFLLGGGPSLRTFNFDLLKNEMVIGINKAFLKFSSQINYIMDQKLYDYLTLQCNGDVRRKQIQEAWNNYIGVKLFFHSAINLERDDVIFIRRKVKRELSSDIQEGIFGGSNSGFGALMLAIALGCNPIYLLGFDMKIDEHGGEDKMTHWHEGYYNQVPSVFKQKLKQFSTVFEEFAPKIAEAGFNVINLNLDSGLECFPKGEVKKVLRTSEIKCSH